jgi:hypothetical protein
VAPRENVRSYSNLLSHNLPQETEKPTKQNKKKLQVASLTVQSTFSYKLSRKIFRLPSPLL